MASKSIAMSPSSAFDSQQSIERQDGQLSGRSVQDITSKSNSSNDSTSKGWKIAKPVLVAAIVAGLVIGALAALYFTGAINWLAQQGVLNPQVTMITTLVGIGVALVATSVLVTKAICDCRKANEENQPLLVVDGLDV